ncbi:SDR family NAD(P)-dependent oxidoreductase [Pyruvatibacter mobilis]|uniref:Glucose 1-dehydrogenase n=1 Tax=Pyruvatibacter mobilis TaxID=1712261 RepID=A0A845QCN0_9HYPH|nr:SDR family NAD(P)-dependent oxidoreductase [Pyruvatibacter mobilis]NBG96425.1 glucose 1-dehydrogenase [Pyruvatibacter mobilis]QJD75906.1 SDR family oxidoreductase [Pyruvatibacter mobilis]GGD19541.1 oxidoreductase [Pyruvatibacter mobilis]
MGRLEGKRAIVTGAGSGIGRAAARLFAEEGATVLAVDLNADGVAETVEGRDRMTAEAGDVSSEEYVADSIRNFVDAHGGIDIVFANAGISGGWVPLSDQTPDYWEQILKVNLIGPFLYVKHASPHMVDQGAGSIICTASVAGIRANAGVHPYSASKAGVISLVQTVAYDLAGTGVRINAVCPGLIETGMTKPIFDMARGKGTEDRIGQINPLKRAGRPEEIANMALFLASDEASYVNGQAFPVDGGLSASHPYAMGSGQQRAFKKPE